MRSVLRVAVLAMAFSLAMGCSHVVPKYSESVGNVSTLKAGGQSKVAVAEFTGADTVQTMVGRGNTFKSPYGSFSAYLKEALRMELVRAERFDPASSVVVEGELQANAVDIGVEVGRQDISARFTVSRNGTVTYNKVHSARSEWQSAFVGAVAIPAAQNAYPGAVEKLLKELFGDKEFIAAIK